MSLDLSRADGQKHFLSLLNEPSLVYVHLSPPCGTAVRTAEAGLRDDLHPHGRPSLKGADKVRVNQANRLFEFLARACKVMYMRGILFSIEGPLQSFLWSTTWWREFLADVPIFVTTLHQCMFGHPRKKATVLLGNISLYEKLSACRSSIYCKAQLYCSRNMWNIQSNQILHSADQCFNSSGWLRACELRRPGIGPRPCNETLDPNLVGLLNKETTSVQNRKNQGSGGRVKNLSYLSVMTSCARSADVLCMFRACAP